MIRSLPRSRAFVMALIVATMVVATIVYLLAARGTSGSIDSGAPATTSSGSTSGSTTRTGITRPGTDTTDTTVVPVDATQPAPDAANTPAVDSTTTTTGFKKRADGTYEPTGADQSAYPTYPGGDFDDTTPNTATSAGVDENGCDNNYSGACVPPLPARVTCADIGVVNFEVVLGDPQGLDPDNDGLACDNEDVIRTPEGEGSSDPKD